MTDTGILQNLIDNDFGYKSVGRKWGRSDMHSSLVVDEEKQRWWWNSRDMQGDARDYLILVRGMSSKLADQFLKEAKLSYVPVEVRETAESKPYEKLVNAFWEFGKKKREYWYTRKLTDRTIDLYRLGHYNGWNVIPLFTEGKFINFQCRRDVPNKSIRYWYGGNTSPSLINQEVLNYVSSIVITEGAVDSILLNQEGISAISHTGGSGYWNPQWYTLFRKISNIYYIADNDKAGDYGAVRISNSLGQDRVKILRFKDAKEKYDTGDFFKDGGTAKQFRELLTEDSKYIYEIPELSENRMKKGFGK